MATSLPRFIAAIVFVVFAAQYLFSTHIKIQVVMRLIAARVIFLSKGWTNHTTESELKNRDKTFQVETAKANKLRGKAMNEEDLKQMINKVIAQQVRVKIPSIDENEIL